MLVLRADRRLAGIDAEAAGEDREKHGEPRGHEAEQGKCHARGFGLVILRLHPQGDGGAGRPGGDGRADALGQRGPAAEHHAVRRDGCERLGLSRRVPDACHAGQRADAGTRAATGTRARVLQREGCGAPRTRQPRQERRRICRSQGARAGLRGFYRGDEHGGTSQDPRPGEHDVNDLSNAMSVQRK